eukprot:PITA_23884
MVNGRPASFFQAHRGLRQGCPLSPFLYIVMADSLSRKLTAEMNTGDLPGIRIANALNPINNALFADDSILLGGASTRIAVNFDVVLKSYCRASGAVINDRKSSIFGWNVSQHNLNNIAQILGFECFAQWDSIKYLGLPLTSGVNNRSLWQGVISKIKDKITSWGGYWLTKGGKIILLKSALSALPIYQASFLLAPKHIMEQISCLLRDFLWKGGRGNQNKIHLVNWDLVKRPILEGGLQIRDPALSNLSLGCKLLWKIYSDPTHQISETFIAKYAQGISLRHLSSDNTTAGTCTWNLCRKSISSFSKHLYRIPGNGEKTLLWKDRIMNNPPLSSHSEIWDIRKWLHDARISKLNDISEWDSRGNWVEWAIPPVPAQLQHQTNILKPLLLNAAPIHRNIADRWGCAKCKNSGETAPHLFIDCVYAKEVWTLTLLGLPTSPPQHSSIADLFSEWHKFYPHSIPKKSLWHLIWLSIPKFVCWEIWLAWNELIFNNSSRSPAKSASIAKGLLIESVLQHSQTFDSSLLPSQKAWLNLHSPHPSSNVRSLPPPLPSPPWKIRESEAAFQNRWKTQNITSIFFDGASKGNSGAAGSGGVFYFADNLRKVHFCWGLGISTKNQAELLALTKACQIARDKGTKECQVFGDSEILISKINSDAQFNNAILNKSLNRLKLILQDFTSFKIYHILRSLNKEADEMANKGCLLATGTLNYNGNNANSICIP